jgi:hypothetical protein
MDSPDVSSFDRLTEPPVEHRVAAVHIDGLIDLLLVEAQAHLVELVSDYFSSQIVEQSF